MLLKSFLLGCLILTSCGQPQKGDAAGNNKDSLASNIVVPDTAAATAPLPRPDAPTPEKEEVLKENVQKVETAQETMTLTPSIEQKPEGILFVLNARRNAASTAEEWMPSSENFRVQIISAKGGEIWNSAFKRNFLTVVGKVKPEEIGGTHRYEMLWAGGTNTKEAAPAGRYTARLVIPARPVPYAATIEFDWKGK